MSLIVFIIVGLIAGFIARALVPNTGGMSLLATLGIGMLGSLLGGIIGSLFRSGGDVFAIRPGGIILSVIGAVLVLLLVGYGRGRRARA